MVTPLPFAFRAPTPSPSPRPRRVLLVEREGEFARTMSAALEKEACAVQRASSAESALELLDVFRPDVALVDLALPGCDGLGMIRELVKRAPGLPVVVVTLVNDEARILEALRAGATGYVFENDVGERIVSLIEETLRGGAPLSRPVARLLLKAFRGDAPEGGTLPELTPREKGVLAMLAEGTSYAEVGVRLGVSENTVRSHVRSIYDKLGVSSKTEAVMTALRLGLVRVR